MPRRMTVKHSTSPWPLNGTMPVLPQQSGHTSVSGRLNRPHCPHRDASMRPDAATSSKLVQDYRSIERSANVVRVAFRAPPRPVVAPGLSARLSASSLCHAFQREGVAAPEGGGETDGPNLRSETLEIALLTRACLSCYLTYLYSGEVRSQPGDVAGRLRRRHVGS